MVDQDVEVVGIDQRALRRRVEEVRRIPDDKLIERGAARHEHRGRSATAASGASGPLPGGRDRAGIAGHHAHVERADIDAELQRIGRDDGADAAFAQALLDFAPPLRQVAAAIAANLLARARRPLEVIFQIRRQELGRQAALRKDNRLQAALEELAGDAAGLAQIRAPDAELLADDRRVDEEEELLASRRAVLRHQLERLLDQRFSQLARIGNRRRRADERRIRAVVPADPPQPAQHIGQVAAEDTAIRMELVDDDVAKVLEQLRPARMVRQDPRVNHVGVGQHDVRAAADRAPRILRRIAVVREDADPLLPLPACPSPCGERTVRKLVQLGQLILRKRLCRKQVQRARGRVAQDGAEHRRVVAERLAGSRWRGDDDVAPRQRMLDRHRLVRIQLFDAARSSARRAAGRRCLKGTGRGRPSWPGRTRTAVTQPSGMSRGAGTPPVRRSRTVCRAIS